MVLLIEYTLKVHAVEGKGAWDEAAYTVGQRENDRCCLLGITATYRDVRGCLNPTDTIKFPLQKQWPRHLAISIFGAKTQL
jgi:hypothetical protein